MPGKYRKDIEEEEEEDYIYPEESDDDDDISPCYDCDDAHMPMCERSCDECTARGRTKFIPECHCDHSRFTQEQSYLHDMYGCDPSFPQLRK